ncbi:CPBP family intramembrane glutamic endopeptidase [Anaerolentibacter hominis]|uniref:CPBP family intramembrane glutamic endopeptidase n=1 Tax=Anaerolentibacter hominis TaxID=3079009 RepID=UPI0031B8611A
MSDHRISIKTSLLWTGLYFCVMLLYTAVDLTVWRKLDGPYAEWCILVTMIALSAVFLLILQAKTSFRIKILEHTTRKGILLAVLCAVLFYFLLDKGLDPFFERLFPVSETAYQESMLSLAKSPVSSFIHVCLAAPVIEEILMRGFVLGGLRNTKGGLAALLISAVLFALLHFNMVQTLSALVCGVVLGLLYIKTGSLFCCILTHCLYNVISYFVMLFG